MTAAMVAAALGSAYRSGRWWRCCCPAHGSIGSTLALRDTLSGLVVFCHAGCRRDDVITELRRLGVLGEGGRPAAIDPAELKRQREADDRRRQQRIREARWFWGHETVPPSGIVEAYWRSRGLGALAIPPTIRSSRSWLRHPEGGSRPAMVALVELCPQSQLCLGPVGIHRTFLATDGSGKASFGTPRLSLGPIAGGAVRLARANEQQQLVIAEGVETAASVMLATGLPAWAALSASGIERLLLPPLPLAATVIIAADHDRSGVGLRAARVAAKRWMAEGRRVRIAMPSAAGSDFNDLLNMGEVRHVAA
jgi:putative DNA primase/helicase